MKFQKIIDAKLDKLFVTEALKGGMYPVDLYRELKTYVYDAITNAKDDISSKHGPQIGLGMERSLTKEYEEYLQNYLPYWLSLWSKHMPHGAFELTKDKKREAINAISAGLKAFASKTTDKTIHAMLPDLTHKTLDSLHSVINDRKPIY